MHLIVTKVNEVRYRNYASLSFDFADRKGGWREDLHRLTLYTLRLPSAVADAIYAPAAVKRLFCAARNGIKVYNRIFGKKIAIGVKFEIIAGFIK
nr:Uncharacterised protein [Salmonella sp. NCTC 7297]